jgi:hypothetical protein
VNSGGLVALVGGLVGLLEFMNPLDSLNCVGFVGVAGGWEADMVGVSVRMMPVDFTTVPIVEHLVHTLDDSPYVGGGTGVFDETGGVGSAEVLVVVGGPPGKRVIRIVESLTQDVDEAGGD